ncbi:hypothetical protein EAS64_39215 [Trebonia kvetii]|uniref:Uncharacterized protein n=1 Tax=Trebonia kvetii TaxID=2480626 RepID=A0A6P2BMB6_9ACTN|nr:hypothetical protein EAS64_39215 [Trebonia kvetii]
MLAVAVAWVLAGTQNSREVGDDVADGQVKLLTATPHEEKATGTNHRIPDDTTETTQVKELLEPVNPDNAVVTAGAQLKTAGYIVVNTDDGNRDSDYPYVGGRQDPLLTADPPTRRPMLGIRRPRERQRAAYHTEQHADEETTEIGSGP